MKSKALQGIVSYFKGHAAENIARQWLEKQGYQFIAQNVKTQRGTGACELDLVMMDKKVLVFIEVKKRKTTEQAMQSILPNMQKRLYKGAENFLSQNLQYQNADCRFDVICFDEENNITHLQNVISMIFFSSLCFLLIFLTGCTFIGTTYNITSKVGSVIMDERDIADDWTDTKINMSIRTDLAKSKISYVMDIEITVFEGEVMLNGAIPTIEDIEKIVEIAWQTPEVKKVYNEIRLDMPSSVAQSSADALIASSVRTQLLATGGITSVNYKITVDNGKLYMMGIAKNQEEFNAVINIIQQTSGISGIVSHVRLSKEE